MAILALIVWYLNRREKPVFLINFTTFEPPAEWKVTYEQLMICMRNQGCFTEESLDFTSRMLIQSGCGPSTAWPPGTVLLLSIHISAYLAVCYVFFYAV